MTFRLQEAESLFYFCWTCYIVGPKPYSTYRFEFLSLPFLEEFEREYEVTVELRVFSAFARFSLSLVMPVFVCVRVWFLIVITLSTSAGDGPPCTL